MLPFLFVSRDDASVDDKSKFLAGGTTLVDLMKLDVERPEQLINVNAIDGLSGIELTDAGLKLGATVRMAEAADHPDIKRLYPVIAQSLALAASPQIRNMASLGGNVLQRSRCTYFRDTSYQQCNKGMPGSGCAALQGVNRHHGVLGVSDACISSYPGDFAQALIALDAQVETSKRTFAFSDLHLSSDTPDKESILAPGEMIKFYHIPAGDVRRSVYLKVRDRESYQFALASAAVVLELDGDTVKSARIALGGVAYKPWRAREAEQALVGQNLDDDTALRASEAAFASARPHAQNMFKVELGKQTLVRALMTAKAMEV